jgi:hypothetical protein
MIMRLENLHQKRVEATAEYVEINLRNQPPYIQDTGATLQNAPIIIIHPYPCPKLLVKVSSDSTKHDINPVLSSSNHTQQEQVLMTNNDSNNDNNYDNNNDSNIYTNKETVATVNDSLDEKSHVSRTSQSSSSNPDESISDSSDNDDSVYTTATTSGCRDLTFDYRTRTNEPICPGDVVQHQKPRFRPS